MPTDDIGLALIAQDDAEKLAKDELDKGAQATEWLVKTIGDLYAGNSIYHGDLGTIPAGRRIDFWLGNDVDDEATISYSGLVRTFHRQSPQLPFRDHGQVVLRGKQAIALEIVNTGGNVWGATFCVAVEGFREIINANPNGNDLLFIGRRRLYIWTFTGV